MLWFLEIHQALLIEHGQHEFKISDLVWRFMLLVEVIHIISKTDIYVDHYVKRYQVIGYKVKS